MQRLLGKAFKIIRESKGLSQKEVANDTISVAQLSRFERGVSGLSVDAFYACLKSMNVPLDEFQHVYHNFTQTKDIQFSTELSDAYLEKNIFKIKQILQRCLSLEEKYPQQRTYKLNTIVVKAIIYYCDKTEVVPNKDVQYLMDYLFSVEEWGRYELWLFTNSAGLMTIASLETFASEMLSRTQFYQELPENRKRILQMLLNVISVCIEQNHLNVALKFLNYVESFKKPEADLYEHLLIRYYRGFYTFRAGNPEGLEDMQHCADIMTYLECFGTAQQMREQIANLQKLD